jgi:hypothetical protein
MKDMPDQGSQPTDHTGKERFHFNKIQIDINALRGLAIKIK